MSRERIPTENQALCDFLEPIIDTIEDAKLQMRGLTEQQALGNIECLDKACQWVEAVILGQAEPDAREKHRLGVLAKKRLERG